MGLDPGPDRPFISLAILYAFAGQPALARQVLAEYDSLGSAYERALNVGARREVEAWIALAEDHPDAAVEIARRATVPNCPTCGLLPLGHAYQRLGQPEPAIAALERYLDTPHTGSGPHYRAIKLSRTTFEMIAMLGDTYERLAALHEQQGNVDQARRYLSQLIELWQDGDPEVQPRVAAARARLQGFRSGDWRVIFTHEVGTTEHHEQVPCIPYRATRPMAADDGAGPRAVNHPQFSPDGKKSPCGLILRH